MYLLSTCAPWILVETCGQEMPGQSSVQLLELTATKSTFHAHISLHFQMLFSFLLSPELKAAAWLSSHTQMHLLKILF